MLQELRSQQAPFAAERQRIAGDDRQARAFLHAQGLKKGDRCALLAQNSIRWVAMDLAIMAEGLIVVPLYARQAPAELVAMMKDCSPALICCGDATLRDAIMQNWPEAPARILFDDVFDDASQQAMRPANLQAQELADTDPVTIIYTSGTSGEAKGVVLTAGNVGHMLELHLWASGLLDENQPGRIAYSIICRFVLPAPGSCC